MPLVLTLTKITELVFYDEDKEGEVIVRLSFNELSPRVSLAIDAPQHVKIFRRSISGD